MDKKGVGVERRDNFGAQPFGGNIGVVVVGHGQGFLSGGEAFALRFGGGEDLPFVLAVSLRRFGLITAGTRSARRFSIWAMIELAISNASSSPRLWMMAYAY